jgi:phospholipid/cholesterol/gamma-HCH transport system ATP-binding protein
MAASIAISNIYKSFDGKAILEGIDFEFEAGKVNMIIGASGSGKTVLTKCMVGLITPEKGSVFFGEHDFLTADQRTRRHIRKEIGMLFQGSALFDSQTVFENVSFPLRMFSDWKKPEIRDRVEYCLARVNLTGVLDKFPSQLSGGMKKRVGIARAIALQPKYLFCDEPNSGLDPQTAAVIDELIQGITDEFGTTTVVISHDMKSVLTIGDKIMFLYRGHKAWEGSRDDLAESNSQTMLDFIRASGVAIENLDPESIPGVDF